MGDFRSLPCCECEVVLKNRNLWEKMASTSLSRQLEQLRASSQVSKYQSSKDGGVSLASLGPSILEGVQLGGEQLTLLAKEAVQELSLSCPIIMSFRDVIFKDDPDDLMPDDADVDMEDSKN